VPNFVPDAKILDIPFLFRDKPHARAVLDGPIGQEMLGKFDSKGFKALAWAENGFRHMTNSKRAVNAPEDLKGLKMRTMENPVHVAAYKGFGIVTTPMAFPEVFTALQQGTVDGQENPLSVIMSAKFDQVQKHLSLTGHVYSPCIFLMNKESFEKLSAADKQAFLEAAKEGAKANRARVDADDAKRRGRLAQQGHERGGKRRQGQVCRGAGASQRRVREAVRQGQHRPHPQLQVVHGIDSATELVAAGARRAMATGAFFVPCFIG
jgi:tripartite ATP-independent transporter DctP family solute receptor